MKKTVIKNISHSFEAMINHSLEVPVVINKYNGPSGVLISYEQYLKLLNKEDIYWRLKPYQVNVSSFLTKRESEMLLDDILLHLKKNNSNVRK